ncbi:hypothetical protein C0J52_02655 [Blattella germanica]|nr:hypothetical protein C0J52_02655 [Blattella germanica]
MKSIFIRYLFNLFNCLQCDKRKRKQILFLLLSLTVAGIIGLRIFYDSPRYLPADHKFHNFDNISGANELIIPNIVHYIIFGKDTLGFVPFLSILSALKVQQPQKLYVHSDAVKFGGHYWTILKTAVSFPNTSLEVLHRPRPTHVFGQPLSSVYHATDVARIQVLMECGGIYVDTDTLILRPLDRFRRFEMALGWPLGGFLGTQVVKRRNACILRCNCVLLAHKDARFLPLWLESYKRYQPRDWYYNAGQRPTQQILEKAPYLVHRVPGLFGVQNLAARLYGPAPWPQWRLLCTIHLLSRHPPAPQSMDENYVMRYRTPFGEIARWLLWRLQPRVAFNKTALLHVYTSSSNASSCTSKA